MSSIYYYIDTENCDNLSTNKLLSYQCTLPTPLKLENYEVALTEMISNQNLFNYKFDIVIDNFLENYNIKLSEPINITYRTILESDNSNLGLRVNNDLFTMVQYGYAYCLAKFWYFPDKIVSSLKHTFNNKKNEGELLFFYNEHEHKYMIHNLGNKNLQQIMTYLQSISNNAFTQGQQCYTISEDNFQTLTETKSSKLAFYILNTVPSHSSDETVKNSINNNNVIHLQNNFWTMLYNKNAKFYNQNKEFTIMQTKINILNDRTFFIDNSIFYNIKIRSLQINYQNTTILEINKYYTITDNSIICISSNIIKSNYYKHNRKNILYLICHNHSFYVQEILPKYTDVAISKINTINITLQSLFNKDNIELNKNNKLIIRLHFRPKNELE